MYRAGFATSQAAYAAAEDRVVACLVSCAARLRASRFLCAPDVVTEADVRLFATAVRFDAAYARMFRCGRKTIGAHFPSIAGWMHDIALLRGVKESVDVDAAVESARRASFLYCLYIVSLLFCAYFGLSFCLVCLSDGHSGSRINLIFLNTPRGAGVSSPADCHLIVNLKVVSVLVFAFTMYCS